MRHDGYWVLGRWKGAPVRIHWSAPLGAVVFGRFEFVPAFWFGYLVLILLHELGHLLAVRAVGAQPIRIDVTAVGGVCAWQGSPSKLGRCAIAWAGVGAQAVLLLAAIAWDAVTGPSSSPMERALLGVFGRTNLVLIAFNLLPVRPLDGAEAWPVVPLLWARARQALRRRRAVAMSQKRLETLDKLERAVAAQPRDGRAMLTRLLDEREDSDGPPKAG